ncbi:uroporphyrinogen-III synthase [Polaromonas naphthalenivorans]|uniref:Uroporphyrinogen-III synthase n=1 Tax=Polaromonas naphthalenivorans (strain CJ2) TaxID=365044 RepID=A1VRW0_POLNA|nr:uroporphyrinogen-III synthase [Polaromonas naphthalenivorans]ABM38388.1 uroporphyrinogen-III synthase [Polaromonas naphthalenivorans CJ2]
MTTARVIVTRPAPDAALWVRQLEQAGIAAEAFELIDIAPVGSAADAQALGDAWLALDAYAACLFVSGHAVEHFFKENKAFAQGGYAQAAINNIANSGLRRIPPGLRFMAPGPGTVAALRAAGVPAAQIDAPAADASQFDSEALWRVVGARDWQGRKVLIVRGQSAGAQGATSGRDWIVRQWQGAGASVDFVGVYQRRAPILTDAQVARARQASADGSVWLFSSSEAVANLVGQAGLQGVDWGRARAVATHPRIAQAVRAAGWGVVVESRPALKDIRQALGSIESHYP